MTVVKKSKAAPPGSEDVELDEAKLASAVATEQGEVYVLQWLSKVETSLKSMQESEVLQIQKQLEESLLKLVNPIRLDEVIATGSQHKGNHTPQSAGVPLLGRPSRHLIARCLVLLFQKGESKTLYDVMQFLMRTAGEEGKGKVIPEKEAKSGSLYIAGEVFIQHGHNVMSQFADLTVLCQRIFKNTSQPIIVRYHALLCLSKVLLSGGRSLNDVPAKEIIKSLRQALADRAGAVARGSAECLLAMLEMTNYLSNRGEIEQITSISIKALDTADFITMRSISRLIAALLAHTQKEGVTAPAVQIKKKKKKDGQEESSDEEAGPSTSAAGAPEGGHLRTIMTPKVMFDQLAFPFLRIATTKRGRGAILDVYATLLEELGADWVQSHYELVLKHLIDDIPNHARGLSTRAEVLNVRIGVGLILRNVVGERMLGENAQVAAIEEISSCFLKRYPVLMPGQHPPSKYSLVLALNETAGLLGQLGSAPPQVLDALQEPLLRCLAHPSHSVQISSSWCLRMLCLYNPLHLTATIESVFSKLKRDIASLNGAGERGGADLPKRTTGHARGLAALISVIPQRPLYTSFEINTKVLEMSIELLKNSAEHSLAISAVEIQVAWTLIGSLMTLGPNFVRNRLNQLLNMWRSALPKPADTNGTSSNRSEVEWGFLLHVRECTLGSIYSFLIHNGSSLVTLDTARRIIILLSNSLTFVNGFSTLHPHIAQEQVPGAERGSLTLLDREHMVRRRVFQCFSKLATNPALEPLQESLVASTIQNFAEPDRYVGSAAQAAIAASAGTFTSIWNMSDGYAFGVTSLQRDAECFITLQGRQITQSSLLDWLNRDIIEAELDALQRRPIMGAAEHDPLVLYTTVLEGTPLPSPPATAAVDASLEVFAALLPFQRREIQINAFETLLNHSRSPKLDKNPGRRMAVQANACAAVLGTLRVAMESGNRRSAAGFNNERLTTAIRELIKDALLQGDLALRRTASEAFGRLAAISGSQAMSSQVQFLVDQVVTNRDPDARAGCALAFGAIYSEVGGLAAGPLTKTVVDILMSLSNDPHPTVHFTALEALRMVVDAASLSYSPYVASTLGMLVKLYMLSTHEPEGGSAGSVNLRADLPANQAICRVLSALVGVLGPDLQDSTKVRTLILVLLLELSQEADDGVVVEATKALQHFALFASQSLDLVAWINSLRVHLKSNKRPLKVAAINSFYQLIQRHALMISKLGGNSLVEDFFAQLDGDAANDGVRQVLKNWLRQTADLSPCGWIDLCQGIMSRVSTTAPTSIAPPKVEKGALQDEEAATIDLGEESRGKGLGAQQSRWRTQLFALECLHEVFLTVHKSGKLEHFDTPKEGARQQATQMSTRVGDLIRMAFTASTAINAEIRLEGLTVLKDVIEFFRLARDPDFNEALLLEQHQAPIAAALTPAFTADSTPEVLAKAVQVCAVFVGSGVVKEVEKLGRILKLLTRALESCVQPLMKSLGDVENLSSNATAMLKIAIFTAWGELQVASTQQAYLVNVIKPEITTLTHLWIASLSEYARLRADPDCSSFAMGTGFGPMTVNQSLETPYAGLVRNVLMPHYEKSWYTILHAVAVLLGQGDENILKAMDGEVLSANGDITLARPASEPTLFFFALYGLTFEALATSAGSIRDSTISSIVLLALRHLCTSRYAGSVILQQDIFSDLLNLFYRVIMVDTPTQRVKTIEAVAEICASYDAQFLDTDEPATAAYLVSPKAKLSKCLQLIILTLENVRRNVSNGEGAERSLLIRTCYGALLDIMHPLNIAQKEQLFVIGFYSYSELLRDESSEVDLVGPSLASLRELCIRSGEVCHDSLKRSIHGFLSASIQTIDDMRARSGRIATNKTKNNILAVVVVITSLPNDHTLSQPLLEQFCFQVIQHLAVSNDEEESASLEIAMTSTNCLKTLFLAASRSMNATLSFCIGQFLPLVAAFLIEESKQSQVEAKQNSKSKKVLESVLETVGSVCSIAGDENHCSRLIGIILPNMILFLEENQDEKLSQLVVHQVLAIASKHSAAFRQVVAILNISDRQLIENSIRATVGGVNDKRDQGGSNRAEARKIALKSFG